MYIYIYVIYGPTCISKAHGNFLRTVKQEGVLPAITQLIVIYEDLKVQYTELVRLVPTTHPADFFSWAETALVETAAITVLRQSKVVEELPVAESHGRSSLFMHIFM